ncbi:hypothetical protein EMIT053CA3_10527 [Pseudomonas donghuensis]
MQTTAEGLGCKSHFRGIKQFNLLAIVGSGDFQERGIAHACAQPLARAKGALTPLERCVSAKDSLP